MYRNNISFSLLYSNTIQRKHINNKTIKINKKQIHIYLHNIEWFLNKLGQDHVTY